MKTIHLNLKKKWFDMILSGQKKEEYRELKPSMVSLFFDYKEGDVTREKFIEILVNDNDNAFCWCLLKEFHTITFSNGYSKTRDQFKIEVESIDYREGKEEWGAEKGKKYIVLIFNQD